MIVLLTIGSGKKIGSDGYAKTAEPRVDLRGQSERKLIYVRR